MKLLEALLNSLDIPDKDIDSAWVKEADSRLDAYEAGKIKSVSLEKILSKYDEAVKNPRTVIPAKAGICSQLVLLDSRFRGNDISCNFSTFYRFIKYS